MKASRLLRKASILVPATCLAVFVLSSPTTHAEVVEEFSATAPVEPEPESHGGTKCELVPDPADAENQVFKMSWTEHPGTHVGGGWLQAQNVLATGPGKYKITAKVNLKECGPEVFQMAIRAVDSNNETFQYVAPLKKQGRAGWTEVEWEIDTEDPLPTKTPSWGETVDGKFDYPVKFSGFAVDFRNWKTKGGSFLVDDVSVTKK